MLYIDADADTGCGGAGSACKYQRETGVQGQGVSMAQSAPRTVVPSLTGKEAMVPYLGDLLKSV